MNEKTAIVTGAAKSIGRAIAERLAGDGANVVINYRSSADEAKETIAAIEKSGGKAALVQADITRLEDIKRLFDEAEKQFGRVDVFVANAGVPSRQAVLEVTEEDFDKVFSVNARGVFFCLQEAARRVADGGRIIVVSSSQTAHPAEGFAVYAGSKAASQLFVSVLAQEIGGRNVTVNSVVAGPIESGFLEQADEKYKQQLRDGTPFGRLGQTADIADAVALLAMDESRWISGQHIVVDGAATHF
jgi:3-oxoacyl-[acyl-carrier protein] reductase